MQILIHYFGFYGSVAFCLAQLTFVVALVLWIRDRRARRNAAALHDVHSQTIGQSSQSPAPVIIEDDLGNPRERVQPLMVNDLLLIRAGDAATPDQVEISCPPRRGNFAPDELKTDQRKNRRAIYTRSQRVAPFLGDSFPSDDAFQTVRCRDISASGVSFFSPTPMTIQTLVVELCGDGETSHLLADVVHSTMIQVDGGPMYIVGCSFAGRLSSVAEPCEA
jgi:hypothetical protein